MEEFRIGTINIFNNNQEINFRGNITKDEFEIIRNHSLNIHHHIMHQELFYIFLMNFLEFNKYFESVINSFLEREKFNLLDNNLPELKYISRNANRFLFNYLSSARTYLDHTERYLKNKYGKDSTQIIQFKDYTGYLYDNFFEYRFIYKLRNYAQHCGLPINSITFSVENEDILKKTIKLNPLFLKTELRNNYKEWGQKLNEDFECQPEEISVRKIIGNYYKNICDLNDELIKIESDSLSTSIEYLENFKKTNYSQLNITETTQCCVFYDFTLKYPNSYEGSTFSTFIYPKEMIDTIKNYS